MSKEEIVSLIKDDKSDKKSSLSFSDLMDLKQIANITLEINRDNGDYYYQININDLIEKDFEKKLITNYNWILSNDAEKLYLFTK